jgi:hypothetical protein
MATTSITTTSIGVTIGRHTRLYYAYITTAPANLDAPSTMTLYAATLADVAGVPTKNSISANPGLATGLWKPLAVRVNERRWFSF